MNWRNLIKIIWLNALIFMLGLAIVELLLRAFWPVADPLLTLKRSEAINLAYIESQFEPGLKLTVQSDEGIPGLGGITNFSLNNLGMRGDAWTSDFMSDDSETVFIVGGSTTECLYLDDTASLNARAQNYLNNSANSVKTHVFGAGKSGDFTRDHLAMLSQRIVHLKPKYVVIFCGVNDLRRLASTEFDPLIFPKYPDANFKGNTKKDLALVFSNFQLFRRLYYVLHRFEKPVEEIRLSTNYGEKVRALNELPKGEHYPEIDTVWYMANLKSMIAMCRDNCIEPIIMTQATTWHMASKKDYHWMRYINSTQFSTAVMQEKMNELNQLTRKVALKQGVSVVDLAKLASDKPEYFYDDCHFTAEGADFAGRLIAQTISQIRVEKNRKVIHKESNGCD